MAGLNAKEYLISGLRLQHKRLVNDLIALPEESRSKSYAGCAKSPLYMVAECAWVNGLIVEVLEGGPAKRLTDEEELALYGAVDTTEKALAMLDESVTKLLAAYEALDENTLGDLTDKPFGRQVPLFQSVSLPISHMMYHDGQLNYLQMLLGDDKIHW